MKFDDLKDKLTDAEYNTVRHNFGRKLGEFSEANGGPVIKLSADLVYRLGVLDLFPDDEPSPFDQLPDQFADSVFVARFPGGKMYLVNTEGYSYCRYITPCTVDF